MLADKHDAREVLFCDSDAVETLVVLEVSVVRRFEFLYQVCLKENRLKHGVGFSIVNSFHLTEHLLYPRPTRLQNVAAKVASHPTPER